MAVKSFPPVPNLPPDIGEELERLKQIGFNYAEWVRDRFRSDFLGKDNLIKEKENLKNKLSEIEIKLKRLDRLQLPDISPEASTYLYYKIYSNSISLTNIEGVLDHFNRNYPESKMTLHQFKEAIKIIRERQNEIRLETKETVS